MRAKFIRSDGPHKLGLEFVPETLDEQLLLEIMTSESSNFEFRFHGWETNGLGRPLSEGLTAVRGTIVKQGKTV